MVLPLPVCCFMGLTDFHEEEPIRTVWNKTSKDSCAVARVLVHPLMRLRLQRPFWIPKEYPLFGSHGTISDLLLL
jgi:hypothetical protein